MKRRLLALALSVVMIFSQSGAVLAAENSAAGTTSAEIAAEEEPGQSQEDVGETGKAEEDLTENEIVEPEEALSGTEENADPEQEEGSALTEEDGTSAVPASQTQEPEAEPEEEPAVTAEPEEALSGTEENTDPEQEEESALTEEDGTSAVPAAQAQEPETESEEELVVTVEPEEEIVTSEASNAATESLEGAELCISLEEELNQQIHVGGTFTISPSVQMKNESGIWQLIEGAEVSYEWSYPEGTLSLESQDDNAFTFRRLTDSEVSFSVTATVTKDSESVNCSDAYSLSAKDYQICINDKDKKSQQLFEDGSFSNDDALWRAHVDVTNFEGAEFELTTEVITHNGPEGVDAGSACSLDTDKTRQLVYIEGMKLKEMGITNLKVKVGAEIIGDDGKNYPISASDEIELDVREIFIEPQGDFDDKYMLPGRTYQIKESYDCYVENGANPEGSNSSIIVDFFEFTIEDIEGENVLEGEMQQSGENTVYVLQALNKGKSKVTVKYRVYDYPNDVRTEEFFVYVSDGVYDVDVRTDTGSVMAPFGGSVGMSAQPFHEIYHEETGDYYTCSEEEMSGITYEWSLNILQDNAREQLGGLITVTSNDSDPSKATVSFENIPATWTEGFDVNVSVSIKDGGEDAVAGNSCRLRVDPSYLEVWPTQIDGNIDVGEEITISPEIRRYPGSDGKDFDVLPADQVSFEHVNNGETYQITQDGNNFKLVRKKERESDVLIKASVKNENGEYCEVGSREYHLNALDYRIAIRKDQATGALFDDGTWSCPVEVGGLDGLDYTLNIHVEGYEGYQSPDDSVVSIDTESKSFSVDGAKLKSLGVTSVSVKVSAIVDSYELDASSSYSFAVRESKIERDFEFSNGDMLPGWKQRIDRIQGCYVENSQNPKGKNFDLTVTNVAVSDENVVKIQSVDENGWDLLAGEPGECTVTVTYKDWDGTEGKTETFVLKVDNDYYHVDLWSENGSDTSLMSSPLTICAQARHESYDPQTGESVIYSDEDMSGITYEWSLECTKAANSYAETVKEKNFVLITPDSDDQKKAKVSVDLDAVFDNHCMDLNWVDLKVIVSIKENGEVKARNDYRVFMTNGYLKLLPDQIDGDIDVGEEITFKPELHSIELAISTLKECDNIVDSDHARFEYEIYNNACEITDNKDGSYKIRRLSADDASFIFKAFMKNDDGDEEKVEREYSLNKKNYDVSYEIEGSDVIFSDDERIFGFKLEGLEDCEFELVPEVGIGEYIEGEGFEKPIEEEEGWSFDSSTNRITFDGQKLFEKGYEYIDTRISLRLGGIEVKQEERRFEVRESRLDIENEIDTRTLFIGETLSVDKSGEGYSKNMYFPDGQDVTYVIRSLTYEADESEEDNRDPITLADCGSYWRIDAVRNGLATLHAVYEVTDGTTYFTVERDYTLYVGGHRYDFNLKTSTGSDRLRAGEKIEVFPEICGEGYDWQTGERYNIDTAGYEVRYEVRCTEIGDEIVAEQYGGDFEEASQRGQLWDYEENQENRSITLEAKEKAYGIDLEVTAVLIDPESEEECARTSRMVFADTAVVEVELLEENGTTPLEWNEQLPPGGEITFKPQTVMNSQDAGPSVMDDTQDITYRMVWYTGDGEGDPGHFSITKADGTNLRSGYEFSASDGPFTVKRLAAGDVNLFIYAKYNDEGNEQEVCRELKIYETDYSDGFIKNNDRGDEHFTWYYKNEEIQIKPDRAKLDALVDQGFNVTTTVEMGLFNSESGEITGISNYDPVTKGVFNEQNGLTISGNDLEELAQILEEKYDDGVARLYFRIHSELNGVTIVDEVFHINIIDAYSEIMELPEKMAPGEEQVWEDGKARLYMEDSEHDNGINSYPENGTVFDITITNIAIDNEADREYLTASGDGGDWKLTALKVAEHAIPVTITYTGGPNEYAEQSEFKANIRVMGDFFEAELLMEDGESAQNIKILMNEPKTLVPHVKHISYDETAGEITKTETELPEENGYSYTIEYRYNDSMINISDETAGEIQIIPCKTCMTEYEFDITVRDKDNNVVENIQLEGEIEISVFFPELKLQEDVFYVTAGGSYSADEVVEKTGAQFWFYSMRTTNGESRTVSQYYLSDLSEDGQCMRLGDAVEGAEGEAYSTLSVSEDVGDEPVTLTLTGIDEKGFSASVQLNVVLHPEESHTYGDWSVTKEATCTETGSRERSCTVCKHKDIEDIPTKEHSWNTEYTVDQEATCMEEGSKSIHCSVCGAKNESTIQAIPLADHTYGDWIVTNPATCTEAGSREKVCEICADKVTEEIPANGHNWNTEYTVDQEATCTEAGSKSIHCSVCDEKDESTISVIEATGHTLGHVSAKEATCEESGNIEYWTCSKCGKYFSDSEGKSVITYEETVKKAAGHTLEHISAKAATCTQAGNNEHWACSKCGKYFSDSEGKNVISQKDTVTAATGHTLEHISAKAATCTEAGNIEHWTCSKCGKYFSDENGETEISQEATVTAATGHTLEHVAANAATCTEDGNIEYWKCSKCGKYFSDENGETEISQEATVTAATGHTLEHVAANAATCTEDGNIEYWKCSKCGEYFSDSEGKNVISQEATVTAATGHTLEHVAAKAATCTEGGNVEHWTCSKCGEYFSDSEGKKVISQEATVIAATGHTLEHVAAKAATCTEGGNIEHWTCSKCGKFFTDAEGKSEIKYEETVKKATGHTLEHVAAKAATCTEAGNSEYWFCSGCGKYFSDENGETEISQEATVTAATGHTLEHVAANAATCTEDGNIEYWKCSKCGEYFSDSEGKKVISQEATVTAATGHTLEHVAAKAATCTEDGNIEHWTCSGCGKYFSDAKGETEIKQESTVIKETGHNWSEWTTVKEATEEEEGLERRTCKNDENHTEERTIPKLSHVHNLEHVAAKAATCTEAGNIEYWTCSGCGKYFSDAKGETEIKQESTVIKETGHNWSEWTTVKEATEEEEGLERRTCKNDENHTEERTIPKLSHVHNLEHVEAKAATCTEAGNIEYWTCSGCGKYFSDAKGETEIKQESTVIKETGHNWSEWTTVKEATEEEEGLERRTCKNDENHTEERTIPKLSHVHKLEHVGAKAATCTEAGNSEYWFCSGCGKYFRDADAVAEISQESTVIKATGHKLTHVAGKAATCTAAGNKEYWRCSECGKVFSDQGGNTETSQTAIVIAATGHKLTHVAGKAATCTTAGNKEYWKCSECKRVFSDAEGKNEITQQSTVIAAKGHKLIMTEAKSATHSEAGNIRYWTCSECGKLFSDAEGKTEIEQKDTVVAALIAGWIKNNKGWWYKRIDGTYPVNYMEVIEGKTYGFDESGYMQTGWQKYGGAWHYFAGDGVMLIGWQKIGNAWYYLGTNGAMQTGWQKIGDKWYYFSAGGVMQTGWQKISGKRYYFAAGGVMQTGWQKISGKRYYFAAGGVMQTGWQKISGKWYYFAAGGVMQTGWQKISGKWYYFTADGAMQTGWQKISGKWYYFAAGGAMQTGWQKINGKWYYFNGSGAMLTGRQYIGGKWYVFSSNGAMQ